MKLFKKMIYRSKKGFTLVEMLIVLALLAILMSVAVPGIASYARRIELMELDDSARAIFMAVQNKMTVMKQSGVEIDFGKTFEEAGIPLPDIFEQPLDATPVDGTYIESKPMFALSTDANVRGAGTNNLVTLSAVEGQLYNHNYVIEYDPATGRVFGVFYSEKDILDESYYLTNFQKNEDRTFEKRLQAHELVGYYGGEGELMKVPTGGEVEKPRDVKDSTLEKLVFMLDPPKNADGNYDTGKYYFEVKITGKDANGNPHTITIVPYDKDNPANNYYVENGQRGTVILDSIAPGCGDDHGQWDLPSNNNMSGYVLERDFKGWVYIKDGYRRIFHDEEGKVLPGVTEEYSPYVHGLSQWNLGKDYIVGEHPNSWQYSQYYRIDPGSDIEVTITRYKTDGYLESEPAVEKVNSYFDSLEGKCAIIKAGRHLQNLANQVSIDVVDSARLETDIDFSNNTNDYDSWNSPYTYRGNAEYPYLYNFKPINLKYAGNRGNFAFSGRGSDGVQHVIKYIRIDTVNDPRFKDDTFVRNNTSFFVTFYNTNASDITFYCPVVIGDGDYTGVFFGQCTGGTNIKDYTVINPIVESSGKYVGGLFGEIGSDGVMGHKVYVEEVKKDPENGEPGYFDNYNIDYRRSDDDRGEIKWGDPKNDPYQKFYIKGTGPETYAGGMIGHSAGQLMNSCAAIRVESNGYAGGLVGLADGKIGKCHVGGHTHNGSFELSDGTYLVNIDGKKGAGGLAARATGGLDGNYTTCSVRQYSGRSTYDTFVGMNSGVSGSSGPYAIGALIDVENRRVAAKGTSCADVETDIEKLLNDGELATSYDPALNGAKYPYEKGASMIRPHIGDWPTKEPVFGMFYWEKNSDGNYAIMVRHYRKGVLQEEISTLCTDRDGKAIAEHGYGVFYTEHKAGDITANNPEITVSGSVGTDWSNDEVKALLAGAGIADVKILSAVNTTSSTDSAVTFTCNDGSGTATTDVYYQPLLCALCDVGMTEYQVRSAAQLQGLSTIAEGGSCSGKTYSMTHDIVFNGSYLKPIGTGSNPFEGTFDGQCYRIVNARLDADYRPEAGVFGAVKNATIKSVVVFEADFSGITLSGNGALGGIVGRALGNSSITNCAFTGKIGVSTAGINIAAGGIVGIAGDGSGSITLQNCEAVMRDPAVDENAPEMTVSAHGGVVAAGGIAGLVYNAPISNCYSGGRISASGGENYVGGIIGTNATDTIVTNIENCYTFYKPIGEDVLAHPIGRDRKVGGDEVHYNNCHYLGGAIYADDPGEIAGIMRYADVDAFKAGTSELISTGGFYSADIGYTDDLTNPNTYSFPAVISDGVYNYHYGKSPADETKTPLKDRFGVFYWEKEGSHYNLKVLYYEKDLTQTEYAYKILDSICREKDGRGIAQSGYGYFTTKKPIAAEAEGFDGAPITVSGVSKALERLINDVAGKLDVKCFDYTRSDIAAEKEVYINSSDVNISGKKFKIVPGMFAIGRSEDALTYEIRTQQHLENIAKKLDGVFDFIQSHDIVCSDPIAPIGSASAAFEDAFKEAAFRGTYDGGFYRIENLKVEDRAADAGLFGRTENATIKNIIVFNGSVKRVYDNASANVGGIVGCASGTRIENCVYIGGVKTSGNSANAGGLVGSAENGTRIENCAYNGSLEASVNGAGSIGKIGGIAGNVTASTITHCEATAAVSALDIGITESGYLAVGGIAGGADNNANVEYSYSGGSVKTSKQLNNAYLSGIVGFAEGGTLNISNCYTHMNIPGADDNMGVHPIAQAKADAASLTMTNCHYIEGMKHYANTLDELANINKHTSFESLAASMSGTIDFGTAYRTYRQGLTEGGNYPLPAVVKNDKGELVHYGDWIAEVTPLTPETYGIFYWENEGDKYSVRVRYVSNGKISSAQSTGFCTDMDVKAITDYGYGYLTGKAVAVDKVKLSGENIDNDTKAKLETALRELGFSGIKIGGVKAKSVVHEHKDITVGFKFGDSELMLGGSAVKMKYNPDFCAIQMGPEAAYNYEIRTVEQLKNISHYADKEQKFTQTHDIIFDNNELQSIGNIGTPFNGTYNGGGYRIISPEIKTLGSYAGLFGVAKGATINRVTVFNGKIAADSLSVYAADENGTAIGAAGGIVGLAENTEISGCAFTGTISASAKGNNEKDSYAIGGIVGCAKPAKKLESCEAVAKITWTKGDAADYSVSIGGVAGLADGEITVNSCYSGGSLSAENLGDKASLGGIIGSGKAVKVDKCYSYAKLTADGDSKKNPISNGGTMTNCFYLKGENYYNGDVAADSGITAAATLKELQEALREHFKAEKQYFAAAYDKNLTGKQMYALAAVVRDKNGNYVHYGQRPADDGSVEYPVPPKTYYKVTVKDNIQHGTITVDVDEAAAGDIVTVTITADKGYKLNWINCGSGQNPQLNQDTYTFTMPEQNVEISAEFVKVVAGETHSITVHSVGNGSASCNPSQADEGTEVTVNDYPDWNYRLKSITVVTASGKNVDVKDKKFIMPDEDVTVTVEFELKPHEITVNKVGNGTVSCVKEALANATVIVSIAPDEGWQVASVEVINEWNNRVDSTSNDGNKTVSFTMPDCDATVNVTFKQKPVGGDTPVGNGEIDTSKLGIFRVVKDGNNDGKSSLGGRKFSDYSKWIGTNNCWGTENIGGIIINSDVDVSRVKVRYYNPNNQSSTGNIGLLLDMTDAFSKQTVINPDLFGDSLLLQFKDGIDYNNNDNVEILWVNDDGSEVSIWNHSVNVGPWN